MIGKRGVIGLHCGFQPYLFFSLGAFEFEGVGIQVVGHDTLISRQVGDSTRHSGAKVVRSRHKIETNTADTPGDQLRRVIPGNAQSQVITRSEEHTSELQSLRRSPDSVFCLKETNKQDRETKARTRQKKLIIRW